jgi:hypothetical protein
MLVCVLVECGNVGRFYVVRARVLSHVWRLIKRRSVLILLKSAQARAIVERFMISLI